MRLERGDETQLGQLFGVCVLLLQTLFQFITLNALSQTTVQYSLYQHVLLVVVVVVVVVASRGIAYILAWHHHLLLHVGFWLLH